MFYFIDFPLCHSTGELINIAFDHIINILVEFLWVVIRDSSFDWTVTCVNNIISYRQLLKLPNIPIHTITTTIILFHYVMTVYK